MRSRILPLMAFVSLTACAPSASVPKEHALALLAPRDERTVQIQVEVADTPEARTEGLMWRDSLDPNRGMLFVFPEPEVLRFWMRNTLIPLDIMFFDADGIFVNAFTMEPCEADPCPTYRSAALAKYALEANAGFREENGIGTGWRIDPSQLTKIDRTAE